MSGSAAISVQRVSKKYCKSVRRSMAYGATDLLRAMGTASPRASGLRPAEFWALQDVSFDLRRGEWLGVIGANGAGKSTLLKLLNGIVRCDTGRIEIDGHVSALIELGAGFHPMLTGRENVYVQGAIMGRSRREIDERFDRIAEFAGIGDFLDTPVKYYSSGMFARLGFSIPIHFEPDILLVDEVLAVGDLSFQEKCMRRMEGMRAADKAVLMVSHSLYRIEALCDRALWLDRGRVVRLGPAREVVRAYLDDQEERYRASVRQELAQVPEETSAPVHIERVQFVDAQGRDRDIFAPGERMTVRIHYLARQRIPQPLFNIRVFSGTKDVFEASMVIDGPVVDFIEGRGVVECRLEELPLTPKVYDVVLFARSQEGVAELLPIRTYAVFRISDDMPAAWPLGGPMAINHLRQGSPFYVHRSWQFLPPDEAPPVASHAIGSAPVRAVKAYIQARMSSERFPGKVLAPLHGKPILWHVIQRVAEAVGPRNVVVVTSDDPSDDPLAAYVATLGTAVFRGPLEDVFTRFRLCAATHPSDWIVRISGDSPLISPANIRRAVEAIGDGIDIVTTIHPRTFPAGQNVEVIRTTTLAAVDAATLSAHEREHVTPYFYAHAERYRIENITSGEPGLSHLSHAVDVPDDLRRLEQQGAPVDGVGCA